MEIKKTDGSNFSILEITGDNGGKLSILEEVYNRMENEESDYKGLITLLSNTESMNDEERQYWIDIIPKLEQNKEVNALKRLFDILNTEKQKLEALEIKTLKQKEFQKKSMNRQEEYYLYNYFNRENIGEVLKEYTNKKKYFSLNILGYNLRLFCDIEFAFIKRRKK